MGPRPGNPGMEEVGGMEGGRKPPRPSSGRGRKGEEKAMLGLGGTHGDIIGKHSERSDHTSNDNSESIHSIIITAFFIVLLYWSSLYLLSVQCSTVYLY